MSNENDAAVDAPPRARRNSVTAAATFGGMFGRSNSTAGAPIAPFPGPITSAAGQEHRRRMSISTLGLSGTSPTQSSPFAFGGRRGSVSTERSDSIDESAIEDDEGPGRSNPTTPFARRSSMSFGGGTLRSRNPNGSPGTNGRGPSYTTSTPLPTIPSGPRSGGVTTPEAQASMQSKPRTTSDFSSSTRPGEGGFNWSEQLRSRAESSVSQSQRPNFSTNIPKPTQNFERNKSVGDIPGPPMQVSAPAPARPVRQKPDAFQERILKGDFYMD